MTRLRHQLSSVVTLLSTLGIALTTGNASADTITFSDGNFDTGNWTASKWYDSSPSTNGVYSFSQAPTGGNPGSFGQTDINVQTPGGLGVLHLGTTGFAYDPGLGAILSLDVSYEVRNLAPRWASSRFVLQQDNIIYLAPTFGFGTDAWTSFSASSLSPGDFVRYGNVGPSAPDFTSSGSLIKFGYVFSLSSTSSDGWISSSTGMDNLVVTLQTQPVPEPSTLLLLGTGLVGLVGYGRRQKLNA